MTESFATTKGLFVAKFACCNSWQTPLFNMSKKQHGTLDLGPVQLLLLLGLLLASMCTVHME